MRILLVDIDSRIPNIALKKIEKYHLDKGDKVLWDLPIHRNQVDKIYVSCIFTKNKNLCYEWEGSAEIGGSGYDLKKTLPEEIEKIKPDINIGFTSRGCIRKCPFCFVPEKEGSIRAIGDIYDIWGDKKDKKIILLDNNILALKSHFKLICSQLRKEHLTVDFNQGLDIRLLDYDTSRELKTISKKILRFAWDDIKDEDEIIRGINILYSDGIRSASFYILSGYNNSFEEDLYKFERIKEINQRYGMNLRTYCMRHENHYHDKKYIELARWSNMPQFFSKLTFKEWWNKQNISKRIKYETLL
jgi:hypothetical protein